MECEYYDAGVCRSCVLLPTPYDAQLAAKEAHARALIPAQRWLPSVRSAEAGFRTKAKMVVGGTVDAPTLGILDATGAGVDLQGCHLYPPALSAAFPVLEEFIRVARLVPYDVPARRGELKNLVVTVSPDGQLMVRFVLRSTESVPRLRKHLPWLQESLPRLAVASANILPEHKAVVEGETEILLTERAALTMRVNDVPLQLRPQSFFQTNTDVAAALYRQVAAWVSDAAPASLWDLYCGVGGFALHCLAPGRSVVGVEVSQEAVASANATAQTLADAGVPGAEAARFVAGDATTEQIAPRPDLIIVNPPRRGIGPELARWIEDSDVRDVVYSSCNVTTLAKDLGVMASFEVLEGVVLDMFPHTDHFEVAVRLRRR